MGSRGKKTACNSCARKPSVQTLCKPMSPRILCKLVQRHPDRLCACISGWFGCGAAGVTGKVKLRRAVTRSAPAGFLRVRAASGQLPGSCGGFEPHQRGADRVQRSARQPASWRVPGGCGRACQLRFRLGGRRHVTADTGRVPATGRYHRRRLPVASRRVTRSRSVRLSGNKESIFSWGDPSHGCRGTGGISRQPCAYDSRFYAKPVFESSRTRLANVHAGIWIKPHKVYCFPINLACAFSLSSVLISR
jgi:hypothetical protein